MQSSDLDSGQDLGWYSWQGNELKLRLHMQPRSSRDGFGEILNGRLKIYLTAPPVDGKANDQLTRFLAKAFGVRKTSVRITAGLTNRFKTVAISNPAILPPVSGLVAKIAKNG